MPEVKKQKIFNTTQQLMSGRLYGTPDGDTHNAQSE